jgi:predicted ATPase
MSADGAFVSCSLEPCAPVLDVELLCIRRGTTCFELSKKAVSILCLLRTNPGRFVGLDEIMDTIWSNTFVQPEIVKTYIKQIRQALNDDVRAPRFIETRRGRGYRFIGKLSLASASSSRSMTAEFVGRAEEMTKLESALDAARDQRRKFVFVTGEAGVGKSTLLSEFEKRISDTPNQIVAFGSCSPEIVDEIAFHPILETLQVISRHIETPTWNELISRLAPSWAPILSAARTQRDQPVANIISASGCAVHEMCSLIEAIAKLQPLVLAVEDLQWADRRTLMLIAALARRRSRASFVFVASYRATDIMSEDKARTLISDLKLHCRAEEIALRGFSPEELDEYVSRNLRGSSEIELATVASKRSDCNPFLVKTIVSDAGEGRSWPISENEHVPLELAMYLGLELAQHPAEEMLELQLTQLGNEARRVLSAASVSGRHFCSWSVAQLLDCEMAYVEDVCEKLVMSGQMLKKVGFYELPNSALSPRFAFKHEIYFACLLRRHPMAMLSNLHRKFAFHVEKLWGDQVKMIAADIANRFEYAGDWPRAINYAKIAIQEAKVHSDMPGVERMVRKALKLAAHLPPDQRRREMTLIGHESSLN